ncbi:hypothetical protein A6V39_04415 [Candidatus Mycoplasma haematobovis]|uniref:Uncharacterized protein n=1 Tax=Candidatus Mycoplasma haematobovis TaxID=432608 RepID=A0A1A9QD27_9MOLU|nr:hypothetical protein [Candidatus Mycoplasma haematobovis]OAL10128.1 hypothetical protein A6V39_04415 [Candidatus Mycoplasma haematobovis]
MSPTLAKALAGICGVGALGGAGATANYFFSGKSIRAYIEKTKTSKNKVFLTSTGLDLADIKKKYTENKKKVKPKDSASKEITAEQLEQWCKDNADSKFSSVEDQLYKDILSWCFVNPKTIAQELESKERELIAGESGNEDAWKRAWDTYNSSKESKGSINDSTATDLNGTARDKGGPALQKWCAARNKETKKLYEEDIEAIYGLFETWCTKAKGK